MPVPILWRELMSSHCVVCLPLRRASANSAQGSAELRVGGVTVDNGADARLVALALDGSRQVNQSIVERDNVSFQTQALHNASTEFGVVSFRPSH